MHYWSEERMGEVIQTVGSDLPENEPSSVLSHNGKYVLELDLLI